MKKTICLAIAFFFAYSCSTDNEIPADKGETTSRETTPFKNGNSSIAGIVPLDELYGIVYESYLQQGFGPGTASTVIGNVETTALENSSFVTLTGSAAYSPIAVTMLVNILNQANSSLDTALQLSSLSRQPG